MSDSVTPGSPDDLPFEFRKKQVPQHRQQTNWKAVEDAITKQPVRVIAFRKTFYAVAAALVLLVSVGLWLRLSQSTPATSQYSTAFGEVKHVVLPDGSKVTLNANSQLKAAGDWSNSNDRQVWLEGEAYFEVDKKPSTNQKFIVHTKDIDVEVLGTKFNVNTRHEKAVVALEEGKIRLSANGVTKQVMQKIFNESAIDIKPGELVTLDSVKNIAVTKVENISYNSGWARNEYHFNNTSLAEIGAIIKDVYGYDLYTADEKLLQRKVSGGDLRAANLQELITVLQAIFKVKMTVENKTINISSL